MQDRALKLSKLHYSSTLVKAQNPDPSQPIQNEQVFESGIKSFIVQDDHMAGPETRGRK